MQQEGGKSKATSHWFRFYSEVLNDHKVQALDPTLFKGWVNILCLANEQDHDRGSLPPIDEIGFKLRLSQHSAKELVDALVLQGLLDINPDKSITPHNWKGRQYKSDRSTERVRKHRERKRNVSCNELRNVSVTPPESETETETETENTSSARKRAARGSRLPDDWVLPTDWKNWVLVNVPTFPPDKIDIEATKFANYWQSLTGKNATKKDWFKTWQNRILDVNDRLPRQKALTEKGPAYKLLESRGVV